MTDIESTATMAMPAERTAAEAAKTAAGAEAGATATAPAAANATGVATETDVVETDHESVRWDMEELQPEQAERERRRQLYGLEYLPHIPPLKPVQKEADDGQPPKVPEVPSIPHAPGAGGFPWSTAPRVPREKRGTVDKGPYAPYTRTIGEWVASNAINYASSFGSDQLRLSQINHSTHLASPVPLAGATPTDSLSPGEYRVPSGLTRCLSSPAGLLDNKVTQSHGLPSFKSVTPQLTLFASKEETPAFERSRARPLGPGSYDPHVSSLAMRSYKRTDGHRSSFASRLPQHAQRTSPGAIIPVNSSVEPSKLSPARLERTIFSKSPASGGYTWSRTARVTRMNNADGASRDRGQDDTYGDEFGTIRWRLTQEKARMPVRRTFDTVDLTFCRAY